MIDDLGTIIPSLLAARTTEVVALLDKADKVTARILLDAASKIRSETKADWTGLFASFKVGHSHLPTGNPDVQDWWALVMAFETRDLAELLAACKEALTAEVTVESDGINPVWSIMLSINDRIRQDLVLIGADNVGLEHASRLIGNLSGSVLVPYGLIMPQEYIDGKVAA